MVLRPMIAVSNPFPTGGADECRFPDKPADPNYPGQGPVPCEESEKKAIAHGQKARRQGLGLKKAAHRRGSHRHFLFIVMVYVFWRVPGGIHIS